MSIKGIECPNCHSERIWKYGWVPTKKGGKLRYKCTDCASSFYEAEKPEPKPKRVRKPKPVAVEPVVKPKAKAKTKAKAKVSVKPSEMVDNGSDGAVDPTSNSV